MSRACGFLAAALALLLSPAAAGGLAAPIPAAHFARLPAIGLASISPDGQTIAFIANEGPHRALVLLEAESGQHRTLDLTGMRALGTFWAQDDLLMLRAGEVAASMFVRGDVDQAALFAVDPVDLEARQLIRQNGRMGFNFDTGTVAGIDPESGRFLMPLFDDEGSLNLYAVDPRSGGMSVAARGNRDTRGWAADPATGRYARIDFIPDRDRYTIRLKENAGWRTLVAETQAVIDFSVQGFSPDGDALLIARASDTPARTRILQRVELADGQLSDIVFADPTYDFAGVRRDRNSGRVLGVRIERERAETVWLDPELDRIQRDLEAAFGGEPVSLVDWTPDRTRFLVATEGATRGATYLLLDAEEGRLEVLRAAYPEIFAVPQPERRLTRYSARDGMQIEAYIALPEGEGPHPFVVLPHGGPAARDTGGFDYLAQFLVSRGYGVIQPNFRGSDGYGALFREAGWAGWGTGVMQHDVTDAARHVIEAGLADPERICIAGASYGGYAALAGAVFTPGLYACAVSVNGVSDLAAMLDYAEARFGRESQTARYWRRHFTRDPEPGTSRAGLARQSPVTHADAVNIPVLLLHGEDDTVVPASQSRDMARALRRAGAAVEHVELEGGDHWLLEYETRLAVLERMEAFLAEHLAE